MIRNLLGRPVVVGLLAVLLLLAPLAWAAGEVARIHLGCYLATDTGSSFRCDQAMVSGPLTPRP